MKQQNKVLTVGARDEDLCGKQWELRFQHDKIITKAEITLKADSLEATDKLEELKADL